MGHGASASNDARRVNASMRGGSIERYRGNTVGAPDVVVLDLTVWKVPQNLLMLDSATTSPCYKAP